MVCKEVTIINKLGLHARAASKFVILASGFSSDVRLARGVREVNGKSIMGVMMLAAGRGTSVTLTVDGEDELAAAQSLENLINERFGEDE
jgi:phosphocarrier protein HPr